MPGLVPGIHVLERGREITSRTVADLPA